MCTKCIDTESAESVTSGVPVPGVRCTVYVAYPSMRLGYAAAMRTQPASPPIPVGLAERATPLAFTVHRNIDAQERTLD